MEVGSPSPTNEYDDAISKALDHLFQNRLFLPTNPFKLLIQHVVSHEASIGLKLNQEDYSNLHQEMFSSIPSISYDLIKLIIFDDTDYAGTIQLTKLVNKRSILEMKNVVKVISNALGPLQENLSAERIEVNYVEIIKVKSCLSSQIVPPLSSTYQIDMIMEIIVKGKSFTDCSTIFIRRILEEAHQSYLAPDILSKYIFISINQNEVNQIEISSMRTNRQQILSQLNAAVANGHDIYLEFYIKYQHPLHSNAIHPLDIELATSFIKVKRAYRFTFQNEVDGKCHCFSTNSFESLAFGLFKTYEQATLYLNCYINHMTTSKSNPDDLMDRSVVESKEGSTSTDQSLYRLLQFYSQDITTRYGKGEIVAAAKSMILVYTLLSNSNQKQTIGMKEMIYLTNNSIGHLYVVRSAIQTIKNSLEMIVDVIHQSNAITNLLQHLNLTAEENNELLKIINIFIHFRFGIQEIRKLLLQLLQTMEFSELIYLKPFIEEQLLKLFDKEHSNQPILMFNQLTEDMKISMDPTLPPPPLVDEKYVQNFDFVHLAKSSISTLSALDLIDGSLQMIELTVGMDIIVNILQTNAKNQIHQQPIQTGSTFTKGTITNGPKMLHDFLGFMNDLNEDKRQWAPVTLSDLFLNRTSLSKKMDNRMSRKDMDTAKCKLNPLSVITSSSLPMWEIYSLLGMISIIQNDGYDFKKLIEIEVSSKDTPEFMIIESTRIRYLSNSFVLHALEEGIFLSMTHPLKLNRNLVLPMHLFKFPFQLSLQQMNQGDDEHYAKSIYYHARSNHITRSNKSSLYPLYGAHKIDLKAIVPPSIKNILQGGVIGNQRVLTGIGDAYKIFTQLWNLPPLLPHLPSSLPGIKIDVYAGLSVATALRWGLPHPSSKASQVTPSILESLDIKKDTSIIKNADPIEIEMVYRIKYTHRADELKVRKEFGKIVCDSMNYFILSANWNFERLQIPNDDHSTDSFEVDFRDLMESDGKILPTIESSIAAKGQSIMYTTAMVSENPLQSEDLLKIFEHIITKSNLEDSRVSKEGLIPQPPSVSKESSSLRKALSINQSHKPPVLPTNSLDVKNLKPSSKFTEVINLEDGEDEVDEDEEKTYQKGILADLDDDVDSSDNLDATVSDADRITENSYFHKILNNFQLKKITNGMPLHSSSRGEDSIVNQKELNMVPCVIRFTLLASQDSMTTFYSSFRAKTDTLYNSKLKSTMIGEDHLPRLTISTIWFSPKAASTVWQCIARKGTSSAEEEARNILIECHSHWTDFQSYKKEGQICQAYEKIAIMALLSQNYELMAKMIPLYSSIAFTFKKILHTISGCIAVLTNIMLVGKSNFKSIDNISNLVINYNSLQLTLSQLLIGSLRCVLISDQCIHLRGGCAFLIHLLDQFEELLQLQTLHESATAVTNPDPSSIFGLALTKKRNPETNATSQRKETTFQIPNNYYVPDGISTTGKRLPTDQTSFKKKVPEVMRKESQLANQSAVKFRSIIKTATTTSKAIDILKKMKSMIESLQYSHSKDMESYGSDLLLKFQSFPTFCHASDVMEIVIGSKNVSIDAVVSFVHRAEGKVSHLLDDVEFVQTELNSIENNTDPSSTSLNIPKLPPQPWKTTSLKVEAYSALTKKKIKSMMRLSIDDEGDHKSSLLERIVEDKSSLNSEISNEMLSNNEKFDDRSQTKNRLIWKRLVHRVNNIEKFVPHRSVTTDSVQTDQSLVTIGLPTEMNLIKPKDDPEVPINILTDSISLSNAYSQDSNQIPEATPIEGIDASGNIPEYPQLRRDEINAFTSHIRLSKFVENRIPSGDMLKDSQNATINTEGKTFSTTGFKLIGNSVVKAAETGSMLKLLRAYGNVSEPFVPGSDPVRSNPQNQINPVSDNKSVGLNAFRSNFYHDYK